MKKLLIWDFDGPITDSRLSSLERIQHRYEGVTEDIHRSLFNGNIFAELARLPKKGITQEEIDVFLETCYWPKRMEDVVVEGIPEVLRVLAERFTMIVNSSSPTQLIHEYLEKHNLSDFFQKLYGSEIESKEEKFRLILADFEVSPKDCLLITDTLGDVREAAALDIPSVVVLWGYQLREHFDSVDKKVSLVENPPQLLKAIMDHFSVV